MFIDNNKILLSFNINNKPNDRYIIVQRFYFLGIVQWEDRTKTIKELIKELQSFEDQNLIVMITNDEGETFNSVKLVSKGFVANKDDPDKYKKVYCALHF